MILFYGVRFVGFVRFALYGFRKFLFEESIDNSDAREGFCNTSGLSVRA